MRQIKTSVRVFVIGCDEAAAVPPAGLPRPGAQVGRGRRLRRVRGEVRNHHQEAPLVGWEKAWNYPLCGARASFISLYCIAHPLPLLTLNLKRSVSSSVLGLFLLLFWRLLLPIDVSKFAVEFFVRLFFLSPPLFLSSCFLRKKVAANSSAVARGGGGGGKEIEQIIHSFSLSLF